MQVRLLLFVSQHWPLLLQLLVQLLPEQRLPPHELVVGVLHDPLPLQFAWLRRVQPSWQV